jgi:hypothetical protein
MRQQSLYYTVHIGFTNVCPLTQRQTEVRTTTTVAAETTNSLACRRTKMWTNETTDINSHSIRLLYTLHLEGPQMQAIDKNKKSSGVTLLGRM